MHVAQFSQVTCWFFSCCDFPLKFPIFWVLSRSWPYHMHYSILIFIQKDFYNLRSVLGTRIHKNVLPHLSCVLTAVTAWDMLLGTASTAARLLPRRGTQSCKNSSRLNIAQDSPLQGGKEDEVYLLHSPCFLW